MLNSWNLQLKRQPKFIFLLDMLGALLSAFMLGVVLVRYNSFVGLSKQILYVLAAIPIGFALYDIWCYFMLDTKISHFIKGIAIANLAYCALSVAILFFHASSLTILAWVYFIGEIIIVALLAAWELRIARQLKEKQ